MSQPWFTLLPPDCVSAILDHVVVPKRYSDVSVTCKEWKTVVLSQNRACEHELTTQRVIDRAILHRPNWTWRGRGLVALQHILMRMSTPMFHTLDLSGCTELTNVDELAMVPVLHTLNLSGCTGLTNIDALAASRTLTKIDLTGSRVSNVKRTRPTGIDFPDIHIIDFVGINRDWWKQREYGRYYR